MSNNKDEIYKQQVNTSRFVKQELIVMDIFSFIIFIRSTVTAYLQLRQNVTTTYNVEVVTVSNLLIYTTRHNVRLFIYVFVYI